LPVRLGLPLSRLHIPDLRAELIGRGIVAQISDKTIWRWLADDAIRPWARRSWIFPRDPHFEAKAGPVLDLYAGSWEGQPLGPNEFVLSADEKTSIQARIRCHPTRPPGPRRSMRIEHEYERGGAVAYLAAWDVHHAQLHGRCEPRSGKGPFERFVDQVMSQPPYREAERVFWVVDNGSGHRGQAAVERFQARWRNLRLVHLPIHASWLNQVEIFFSVLQRKVLTPNDFHTSAELVERIFAFQHRYQAIATPFAWKFTRADLARLMRRLSLSPTALAEGSTAA
jgi:hypothetical protein